MSIYAAIKLHSAKNVEECDATMLNSSTKVGNQNKKVAKLQGLATFYQVTSNLKPATNLF